MKKLLILSGKGGTGKTTVSTAFIHMLQTKVCADCDVDAPNLHITVAPKGEPTRKEFYGLPKAVINQEKCVGCGTCVARCKFEAISIQDKATVNSFGCEGCGVCAFVCPTQAIAMEHSISGQTLSYNQEIFLSTAQLKMGEGASGKLVTEVKKNMNVNEKKGIAIIDGSPGIGCPVIASISGVDMVLIVTEPTVSGISDLKRILKTVRHFKTKCAVCINKYDIYLDYTESIQQFCMEQGVEIVGMIPFDKEVSTAINQRKSIVEIDCKAGRKVKHMLDKTRKILEEDNNEDSSSK